MRDHCCSSRDKLTLVLIERNSWKRQVQVQDKLCKERLSHAIQEMCYELVITFLHNMNVTAPYSLIPTLDPQTCRTPSPTPPHLTLLYQHALPEASLGWGERVHCSCLPYVPLPWFLVLFSLGQQLGHSQQCSVVSPGSVLRIDTRGVLRVLV